MGANGQVDLTPELALVPLGTPPTGVAAQRVRLYDSTGTDLAWPAYLGQDLMVNGVPVTLAVDQSPLRVTGITRHASANPILTVAATYVSGDYVGQSGSAMVFPGIFRAGGPGTGILQSAVLIDKATQSIATELWLFSQNVTVPADSAAWTVTDADVQNLLGVVAFSTYYASAANSVSPVGAIGLPVWAAAPGDTSLYGALVTRGAPTYASLDVTVVLNILAD